MNIITNEFKNLFNLAIDSILKENALSSLCTLRFNNSITDICNNCIYDPGLNISSNTYNGIGPSPFPNGSICPVCMGLGKKQNNNKQYPIWLAVIFDSKYFINVSNKIINIPDNSVQTICKISEINQIKNCNELIINSIPSNIYERASDPIPCGLGDQDYIVTIWKRK